MQSLLRFPAPHQSQRIPKDEFNAFVRSLRALQEAEAILAKMRADVEAKRESILHRLELGGEIEDGGRIATG